jgi:hypothetical protein
MTKVISAFREYAKAPEVNNNTGKDVHMQAIKEYREVEIHLQPFLSLTLGSVGGKLHALAALAPKKWQPVPTE